MAASVRRRGLITDINVTPLVDIMLVLLIIFMLTAHLIARQVIEVQLPKAAQAYLGRMEELSGVPVGLVSVGPDRSQTFVK